MLGNFQDGTIPGKIQFGSGWWFLDQKDGMEKQMNALSLLGLLSRFVGMLTDSRSFLSYPRHEYFHHLIDAFYFASRDFAVFHIITQQVAQSTAEIFVTRNRTRQSDGGRYLL